MGVLFSLLYSEDLIENTTENNPLLKEIIIENNSPSNKLRRTDEPCINYKNILYVIQEGNNKQLGFCYNFDEAKYYINNEIKNICITAILSNYILTREEHETQDSYVIEIYERNPNILLSYMSLLCKYTIFFMREINCSNLKQLIKDNELDEYFNPFENDLNPPNENITKLKLSDYKEVSEESSSSDSENNQSENFIS